MRIVKRGEIYYAELYGVGSVQTGSRPVLVYSNNENNRHSSTINVIPLTAELKSLCVHVLVEEYLECGLKEKSISAHRSGIRKIIIPKENEKDIEDIPESVRNDLEIVLADHIDTVLEHAIVK